MSDLVIKGTERVYWDANRSTNPDLFWPSDPLEYPTAAVGKTDNWAHSGKGSSACHLSPVGPEQGLLFLSSCWGMKAGQMVEMTHLYDFTRDSLHRSSDMASY